MKVKVEKVKEKEESKSEELRNEFHPESLHTTGPKSSHSSHEDQVALIDAPIKAPHPPDHGYIKPMEPVPIAKEVDWEGPTILPNGKGFPVSF